jgi:predicted site-specific integrase-resolvase
VPAVYSVKEAAKRLGVASKTINHWLSQDTFPNAYKLNPNMANSPYRIPEDDIVRIEMQRRSQVASE